MLREFGMPGRRCPSGKVYNFYILEVVQARVASAPKYPRTLHYRGEGIFIASGEVINKRQKFTKWKNLPNF
jgi:hypothetical protein